MALDPNIGRIKFLRSKTAGLTPTTADIDEGELALNLVDRTIYTRNGNNIVDIGFGLGGQVNGDITTSGTVKATKLEGPLTGNAATATKLQTARAINGVSFDGTANITIADSTKLPLTGGTLTGALYGTMAVFSGYVQVGNGIQSTGAISFLNSGSAQNINTGGVLVSNSYADSTKIPTNGIYSKGKIHTATSVEVGSSVDGAKDTDYIRAIIHPPTHTGGDWEHTVRDDATYAYYKLKYGTSGHLQLRSDGTLSASGGFDGNAATATTLQTARSFSWTGDATGSLSFNGSANVSAALTLANSGVAAGTYKSVTVDTKGRVTAGSDVITGLVTSTAASGTTNTATSNTNTYLNIVETVGSAATTVGTSTQVTGAGTVTVTSDTAGKLTITGSQNITGNAATATVLQTARTIGGVSFNGSANINLPGVNTAGNQSTTGNAATATKLQTPRAINGVSFDGSANITVADSTKLPLTGGTLTGDLEGRRFTGTGTGNDYHIGAFEVRGNGTTNTVYPTIGFHQLSLYAGSLQMRAGGDFSFYTQGGSVLGTVRAATFVGALSGNATTATKLQTARIINGVSFDGSANITITDNTKLPLTGGTITGSLNVSDTITITNVGDQAGAFKKLIQADTTTDGGYLAVGNNATDKGYVEIGTVDDEDTEIYASQRTSENAVIRRAKLLDGAGNTSFPGTVTAPTFSGVLNGNAATATQLATARTINDVAFNGTANITIADSTKVPLTGGTMTGNLNANALGVNNTASTGGLGVSLYGGSGAGMPEYGLAFSGTPAFGTHGGVVGDWATYFTMSGATNRGWIFKSGNGAGGNVASISAAGEITATSILSSGNITAFSDARLKDNITKIPDALNKLNQLKGVTFTRKDLADDKHYAGLIAQDVQNVLPEAVAVTKDDIISVDYNGVIGLLVEAIKELNNRIDKLERI